MKTLYQFSLENPELYAKKAVEANEKGKTLAIDEQGNLQFADFPGKSAEELAVDIRQRRNLLQKETDKYMLPDYPVTTEMKEKYANYRQFLRDIPLQSGFPEHCEFPEEP